MKLLSGGMPEGVGDWEKREMEAFGLFCERVSREDRNKATSERVALLPACIRQPDTGGGGWHCPAFPPPAASSSLPACWCLYIQLRQFLPKDWKALSWH